MSFTKQQIEDNAICPVCEGQGKMKHEVHTNEEVTIQYSFCEACEGTGRDTNDGDVD